MSRLVTSVGKSCQRLQKQLWQSNSLTAMISSLNRNQRQFSSTTKEQNGDNEDKNDTTPTNEKNETSDGDKKDKDDSKLPNRIFVGSPSTVAEREVYVESVAPKTIVSNLDRYIIGQSKAKRAVAVSLRNRWRRSQLEEKLRKEVLPMNILMMGPTGTGKVKSKTNKFCYSAFDLYNDIIKKTFFFFLFLFFSLLFFLTYRLRLLVVWQKW